MRSARYCRPPRANQGEPDQVQEILSDRTTDLRVDLEWSRRIDRTAVAVDNPELRNLNPAQRYEVFASVLNAKQILESEWPYSPRGCADKCSSLTRLDCVQLMSEPELQIGMVPTAYTAASEISGAAGEL